MKMLLPLLLFFSLTFLSIGCKKENAKYYLVDTLAGSYNTHGQSYWYSIDSPYYSNFVNINDSIVTITKVNDSTLMALDNTVTYCCIQNGAYYFQTHGLVDVLLYFDTANTKSIRLTYNNTYHGLEGTTMSLSGTKIP